MQEAPLMPKATAVWLVENTALSFDQVAEFCKLHPLEVKAIADGEAAQGIKGMASAIPTTAHSATSGCSATTSSIAPVDRRWPATLMMSSVRPSTVT